MLERQDDWLGVRREVATTSEQVPRVKDKDPWQRPKKRNGDRRKQ